VKLDIVIPSHNRDIKLVNCLFSILKARRMYDVDVYVYFNTIEEVGKWAANYPRRWINYRVINDYRVPNFWNSHLKDMIADAMLYCTDDVVFEIDTISEVLNNYEKYFPNFDGVVGINQINISSKDKKEGAFGIIGKKYIDNFPNKQVWCPDYYRFYADYELELYAKSINKFVYCEDIKINHLHGSIYGSDDTHIKVREWLSKDRETFFKRQKDDLLWGKSFKLIENITRN